MRICVPYSCTSAPRGSMLIGWLGHKRRKFRFPVAHTVLPVCLGGRKANEVKGAKRNPGQAQDGSLLDANSNCFLESSLLISILLLQNFNFFYFKCMEYLDVLTTCMYFLLIPVT